MSVKIILTKNSEPMEKRELVFGKETISVGREPSSSLPLTGTKVSKAHARIELQGAEYVIVDLNSTNSTYVNGERLLPGKPTPLHSGDRVNIADYDLQFFPDLNAESTLQDPPERPEPGGIRNTLIELPEEESRSFPAGHSSSELVEKWSKLTAEIQKTLESFSVVDLVRQNQELEARCDALAEENRRLKEKGLSLPDNGRPGASKLAERLPIDEPRIEQVARVLLQLFFKLSSGRSSFLSEFIVRTYIKTSDGLPVQTGPEALRSMTNSLLSDNEFAARLALLEQEADRIVLHMMGLLEGYRRSVDEGARRILQRVDPDRLAEELPDTLLIRSFPPLGDLNLFRLIRNRLRDLIQEDRGVLEKQVFRPGFVRAYEECVEPPSRAQTHDRT